MRVCLSLKHDFTSLIIASSTQNCSLFYAVAYLRVYARAIFVIYDAAGVDIYPVILHKKCKTF